MAIQVRKVLCPVDFSELGKHELELAGEICRVFGATLVLHHNLPATAPAFSKGWEWQGAHRQTRGSMPDAERQLCELMGTMQPSLPMQAIITSGPLVSSLLTLADELPADLMVLGSHGRNTADHASLCDRLMDSVNCPLLCFEAGWKPSVPIRLRPEAEEAGCIILVPTDLSADSIPALEYAFDIARALPVRLQLLEVVSGGPAAAEHACAKLIEHIPRELRDRVECVARTGHPIDEIVARTEKLTPAFLIMGEHARGFARAWLTRHTGREVLHRVHVPIWFVPSR